MTRFHSDDYINFLRVITPDNMQEYMRQLQRFNVGEDCPVFDGTRPTHPPTHPLTHPPTTYLPIYPLSHFSLQQTKASSNSASSTPRARSVGPPFSTKKTQTLSSIGQGDSTTLRR